MKNYLSNYMSVATIIVILIVTLIIYYVMMRSYNPSLWLVIGVLKPVAVFAIGGIVISSFFLFFPQRIFTAWLKRIAWWYVLVLFLVTITTPVFSSNILSLDRGQIVFGGMIGLLSITVPYVVLMHKKQD